MTNVYLRKEEGREGANVFLKGKSRGPAPQRSGEQSPGKDGLYYPKKRGDVSREGRVSEGTNTRGPLPPSGRRGNLHRGKREGTG